MPEEKHSKFRYNSKIKFLIGVIIVILIVMMFPKGESIESEVTEGSIWIQDDLIAPFSFPVKKDPEVYKFEIKRAGENIDPVYLKNDEALPVLDSLQKYNSYFLQILDSTITNDLSFKSYFFKFGLLFRI